MPSDKSSRPNTPEWADEVRRRLRATGVATSPTREAEIIDELAQHLADREVELRKAGLTTAEARRLALDEISDADLLRGEFGRLKQQPPPPPVPGAPSTTLAERLWQDLRIGARTLAHQPAYTLAALCALTLGIGATAAIFNAVDAVLLRPMPLAHADRIYVPVSVNKARDVDHGSITFADYTDWRQQSDTFAAVALWRPINADVTGDGEPERIEIAQVSEEFFRLMDVTPLWGRTLQPTDHVLTAPRVAVLSHGFWKRHFGGKADVVGRTVRIGGTAVEIVGVLPDRRVWPDSSQMFMPLKPEAFNDDVRTRRDNMIFQGLSRLRDDVTPEAANARLALMAARLEKDNPVIRKGWTNVVVPLRTYMVDKNLSRALYVLLAAVVGVLLIACVNVANLALVRGSGRARELGLRVALGASRRRLIQQLAIEGALLATAAAVAGAGLAMLIMKGLVAIAPEETPFLADIHMNGRMLIAMIALAVVTTALSGLVPALSNSVVSLGAVLHEGTGGSGTSRRAGRLRNGLVIIEMAAAVVLLTGAALLIRSFGKLSHVDAGVSVDRVISARISIGGARYADVGRRTAFVDALVTRLEEMPGIASAALTSYVPAGGGGFGLGRVFLAEGRPEPPAAPDVPAQWNVITPDYFKTMGIPMRAGRPFAASDIQKSTQVIIVTESFARRMFPGENALGKRVRSWRDENVLREVVGIVADVKYESLAERETPLVYVPYAQDWWTSMQIVARAREGSPAALMPAIKQAVGSIDPNMALADIRTLEDSAKRSVASQRYATMLLTILAGVALALSALGIYSVTSYVFTLRRREMGIRLALGATRAALYRLVLKHGLGLSLVGLALGLAGAAGAVRLLKSLLYETSVGDGLAWTGMCGTVAVAATIACLLPARRAAGADPTITLRAD